MDAAIEQLGDTHDDMSQVRKVIDEYAIECSILKVWGSEFLNSVVDETVQIFVGMGSWRSTLPSAPTGMPESTGF